MQNANSFLAGAQVRIEGLGDCPTCEVTLSQPNEDNEIILELWDRLPKNYDGWSGNMVISVDDITQMFKVLGIPERYWDDYYLRLVHFQEELLRNRREHVKK